MGLSPNVNYQLKVVDFVYVPGNFVFDTVKDLQINVQTNALSGPTTLIKGSETVDGVQVWFGTDPGETGTLLGSDSFNANFTATSTNNTPVHSNNTIVYDNVPDYKNYFSSTFFTMLSSFSSIL